MTQAGARPLGGRPPAAEPVVDSPVAEVLVDVSLPHLDRTFDYLVPASLAEAAQPGSRVKVRFSGTPRTGFVIARRPESGHGRTLTRLSAVTSSISVLTPEILALARAVAERFAGTTPDVLRLAIPPRHAGTERRFAELTAGAAAQSWPEMAIDADAWSPYHGGSALLRRIAGAEAPRAAWLALPGTRAWARSIVAAAVTAACGGRGVVIVVPDGRDVARVESELRGVNLACVTDRGWSPAAGPSYARLVAEDGLSRRYRSFLATLSGHARIVVGTRAAAFAPVVNLGLAVCWDDGDDLHAERRAPYCHTREVLAMRSHLSGCALIMGGYGRSCETQQWVERGWCRDVRADRQVIRLATPVVRAPSMVELAGDGGAAAARLPAPAFRLVRRALTQGPVLVQVPRQGYVPVIACAQCRLPARCAHCEGPLTITGSGQRPTCRWCGCLATDRNCPRCGSVRLRSVVVGSERTAEELGRAFPQTRVIVSGRGTGVLDTVGPEPALVVATPGAEPIADGAGYAAALLLDAAGMTNRPDLRAAEEALRRWLGAAALVRASVDGGEVLLLGDGATMPSQALVRWDPVGFAARELAERAELRLPPAIRMAALNGSRQDVTSFIRRLSLPKDAEILGPVPARSPSAEAGAHGIGDGGAQGVQSDEVRALVRAPLRESSALTQALRAGAALRSAHKDGPPVRIELDPVTI